jgi:hypothetical protein
MTRNGYPPRTLDPFATVQLPGGTLPDSHLGAPVAQSRPVGEMNTFATLSILFAFVFAPVGAVMSHLALSQIKHLHQRGRDRALVGLTLSYVFILFMIVALLVWALTDHGDRTATVAAPSTRATAAPPPPAAAQPRTTVVTPAPPVRKTATVEELHVGECVEIQQTAPDPNDPGAQQIKIFPVSCQARDGVFTVVRVAPTTSACTDEYLTNQQRNLFACISKFGGAV